MPLFFTLFLSLLFRWDDYWFPHHHNREEGHEAKRVE
jgi:hypothetical protein